MPFFQAMASRANTAFTPEKLEKAEVRQAMKSAFGDGKTLVESLKELKVVRTADEEAFLSGFPSGLLAAVGAVLTDNAAKATPLPVTVAWAPGYEDEVSFWVVEDTATSRGGITIMVRSRYADDRTEGGPSITTPPP